MPALLPPFAQQSAKNKLQNRLNLINRTTLIIFFVLLSFAGAKLKKQYAKPLRRIGLRKNLPNILSPQKNIVPLHRVFKIAHLNATKYVVWKVILSKVRLLTLEGLEGRRFGQNRQVVCHRKRDGQKRDSGG